MFDKRPRISPICCRMMTDCAENDDRTCFPWPDIVIMLIVPSIRRGAMRDRMLGSLAESGLQGEGDYGERGDDEYARPRQPAPP